MIEIAEFIKLPKAERQKHLDLSTPCEIRGGCSKDFRIILARMYDTNLPLNGQGRMVHLAHACNNKFCCNHLHLYWATPKENAQDEKDRGAYADRQQKYRQRFSTPEEQREFYSSIGKKGGSSKRGQQ